MVFVAVGAFEGKLKTEAEKWRFRLPHAQLSAAAGPIILFELKSRSSLPRASQNNLRLCYQPRAWRPFTITRIDLIANRCEQQTLSEVRTSNSVGLVHLAGRIRESFVSLRHSVL